MGIASAVSAAVGLAGAFKGSDDQDDAADAIAAGNGQGIAEINAAIGRNAPRFDEARENFNPFLEGGTDAVNFLTDILLGGVTPDDALVNSPGFNHRVSQGEDAIQRALKAQGNFLSGGAVEELIDFNQGQATSEFDAYIRRLFGLTGVGENAAGAIGNLTSNQANQELNAATQVAQLFSGSGAARGSAELNGGVGVIQGVNDAVGALLPTTNPLSALGNEFQNFQTNLAVA